MKTGGGHRRPARHADHEPHDLNAGPAVAALHFTPVTGNTAGREGGGIWNGIFFPPGRVTLDHSPVQGNRPDQCYPAGSVSGC